MGLPEYAVFSISLKVAGASRRQRGEVKCNYNVINEQALLEKITHAQEDVDAQQNTSNTKRSAVHIEGHNLLSLPWLVSLVDLNLWTKVPLRRCALRRVTRIAGLRGIIEPALREAAVDKELKVGFVCDHFFASDILVPGKKADTVLIPRRPGRSFGLAQPRWGCGPIATRHP